MPIEEGHRHPQINPEVLRKISRGGRVAEFMPDLEAVLGKAERQLTQDVFKQIKAGTLTPQAARDAWAELYVYHNVRRRFEILTKEAQALGSAMRDQLEDDNG